MPQETAPNILINRYVVQTIDSLNLLYTNKLYGQLLIIFYSSIDAMGLLDAAPNIETASGVTFKSWVKKFFLPNGSFAFNADDMWSARCAVLHTYTTSSDLSKKGKAKELQYVIPQVSDNDPIVQLIRSIDSGQHIEASITDMLEAFTDAVLAFREELIKNCTSDRRYLDRLRKILVNQCL